MEYKFVISVRKEYENRENGLKANILWIILGESDKNRYSHKKYIQLAQEIENKVTYRELSEYTFDYLGDSYSFKVDSLCPILSGDQCIIAEEDLRYFEGKEDGHFMGKRKSCIEEYDEAIKFQKIDNQLRKEGWYPSFETELKNGEWEVSFRHKENLEIKTVLTKFKQGNNHTS